MPGQLVREVLENKREALGAYAYGALPNNIDLDKLMNDEDDDEPIEITCTPRRLKQLGHAVVLLALVSLTFVAVYMSGDSLKKTFEPYYSSFIYSSLDTENAAPTAFTLTSPAFEADGTLPDTYTCKLGTETGVSPPLAWSGAPEGTVDYMVTMKKESGYSWTLYDLGTLDHVDAAVSNAAGPGATVGQAAGTEAWDIDVPPYISTANYVSMYKYEEPCSKGPGAKWYLFTVYAFSRKVTDVLSEKNFAKENTKPTQILEAMDGYVLGQVQVTAYFNLYDDDQAAAAAKEETKELEESGSTGGTAGPASTPALAKKNGGADPKHSGGATAAGTAGSSPASTTTTATSPASAAVTTAGAPAATAPASSTEAVATTTGTTSAGTYGTPPPPERKHLRR